MTSPLYYLMIRSWLRGSGRLRRSPPPEVIGSGCAYACMAAMMTERQPPAVIGADLRHLYVMPSDLRICPRTDWPQPFGGTID